MNGIGLRYVTSNSAKNYFLIIN